MSGSVQCQNCGAMMKPAWDGRVYKCPFCGTQMQVAIGGDQIAAGMAVDLTNIEAFLARLAATLHQGFQEHSTIQANGPHVVSIEVNLEPDFFAIHRESGRAVATHKKVVRGIALRTKQLAMDVWFDLLTDALANHANVNARASWVLSQLGKGGDS